MSKWPLLSIGLPQYIIGHPETWADCLENECGVWDTDKHCCSLITVGHELTRIQLKLRTAPEERRI